MTIDREHALRILEADLLDVIGRMDRIAQRDPVLAGKAREFFGLASLNACKAYAEACIERKKITGEDII